MRVDYVVLIVELVIRQYSPFQIVTGVE